MAPPEMVEVVDEPMASVWLPEVTVVEKGEEPVLVPPTRLVEVGGLPKMTSVWPVSDENVSLRHSIK